MFIFTTAGGGGSTKGLWRKILIYLNFLFCKQQQKNSITKKGAKLKKCSHVHSIVKYNGKHFIARFSPFITPIWYLPCCDSKKKKIFHRREKSMKFIFVFSHPKFIYSVRFLFTELTQHSLELRREHLKSI